MTERTCYEFDYFRVDPVKRTLLRDGQPVAMTARAFALLLLLVRNHGRVLSKKQLIEEVWGGTSVAEGSLHVNLTAVRKALGDLSRSPTYIARMPGGYCFVAEVLEVTTPAEDTSRELTDSDSQETQRKVAGTSDLQKVTPIDEVMESGVGPVSISEKIPSLTDSWDVWASCALYAMLYSIAVLLEVAYEWDRYGGTALLLTMPIFAWMTFTSVLGLKIDLRLTLHGKYDGLLPCIICFVAAAAMLLAGLSFFLPQVPITQSTLQAYPAQAAYLKDMVYFLILGFFFLILPFHFVVNMEREIARGKHHQVLAVLTKSPLGVAPKGTVYPRFWALAALLVTLAAMSIAMTSYLLDHLKLSHYTNLFTLLVYLRGILYFGLGIECLIWYQRALNQLKLECQALEGHGDLSW